VYAAIDGRVEVAGSAPSVQINLFYPDAEDGFLIYHLRGDWQICVAQGANVTQGTLLALGRQPVSDSQASAFSLGCGMLLGAMGFADVELPDEIVALWQD